MSDEAKKEIDKIVRASHDSGSHVVYDIFDGFKALSRLVQEQGRKRTEMLNERRRRKARERYALNKKLGIPNRKPKAAPEPELPYEAPTSCYCHMGYPPCGWCTREIGDED
jgi:hypothetical protein